MTDLGNTHRFARETGRLLRTADEILGAVYKAREGSILARGLAVASGAGSILRALLPLRSPHEQIVQMGYKPVHTSMGKFLCATLTRSEVERRSFEIDEEHTRAVMWSLPGAPDAIAALYQGDVYENGPYVLEEKHLVEALGLAVWRGPDLMLTSARSNRSDPRTFDQDDRKYDFDLVPLGDPGVFYGTPGADWYAERMRRHSAETRSLLLVGATGTGKSTLGRLIARSIEGGRLLKVSSNAIKSISSSDVIDLVTFLQPTVLLLDDMAYLNHRHGDPDVQMLELLEALHGRARLVIATAMFDWEADPKQNYFAGMRPGRVDEVIRVPRPGVADRRAILTHYLTEPDGTLLASVDEKLLAALVKGGEGLTGAYLGEVVHRLRVHGVENWRAEIESVLAACPAEVRQFRGMIVRRRRKLRKARQQRQEKKKAFDVKIEKIAAAAEIAMKKAKKK